MQLAMVAAGFTPGEADELRRAMAAWRRKGGLEPFEQRLKDGHARARLSARVRRAASTGRSCGFGEYGFPESHAASFALLVYVSAWLKRHHPAAFCAALLNSQPMGFYAPSQLVQDARRHGVEVRPVDVCASDWDCTLEDGVPAVRLGCCMVKGLSEAAAAKIVVAARRSARSQASTISRAAPASTARDLKCLAAAGALSRSPAHRRLAHWDVAGAAAARGAGPAAPRCAGDRAAAGARAADRRRGPRRRLRQPGPHARPASARAAARPPDADAARHRRGAASGLPHGRPRAPAGSSPAASGRIPPPAWCS